MKKNELKMHLWRYERKSKIIVVQGTYIGQGYRQVTDCIHSMWQWNVTNIHDVIYPLNRRWVTLVNTLVLDTVLLPGLSGEVTPAARVSTTYNDSLFTWRNTLKHILVYCMMLIEMYIFKSCNNLFILQKKTKKNP